MSQSKSISRASGLFTTAVLLANAGQALAAVSATGYVTPDPATSTPADPLYIGDDDLDGAMHITGGSRVDSYRGYLAQDRDVLGTVSVIGIGSQWVMADGFYVGFAGDGYLTISAGGNVTNTFTLIGDFSSSYGEVLVTGPTSSWTQSGNLYVGFDSNRESLLTIDNGATVSNVQGMIGDKFGSMGRTIVRGGSIWNNSTDLIVGFNGTGALEVSDGSRVTCESFRLASSSSSSVGHASVMGPGTNVTCTERVYVGWRGTASLTIGDGATVTAPEQARVAGSKDSTGTLKFVLTTNGPGKLSTDGNLYLTPIGSFPGESTANLIFETDGSHSFTNGDTFDLIDWGGTITGTWDSISLPELPLDLVWNLSDLEVDGSLSVMELIAGDMNSDGVLTEQDISPFVQALTDPQAYAAAYPRVDPDTFGDFNGDGLITNADIAGFVNALGVDPSAVAIPEPTSLALLGFGGLFACRRRR